MITLEDCKKARTIEESTIFLVSKVTYYPRKAYTQSTDGVTFWEFGTNLLKKIKKIKEEIEKEKFNFLPFRKIKRKTKLNKIRDIYLSTWRDKVVDRWLNDCLGILLHNWFSKNSYAYRIEGVGLDSCISDVTRSVKRSQFFIKRDITQYFYTIDHEILLSKLALIIDKNDYLYELLRQRVHFNYEWKGKPEKAKIGVPFGSSLACVLANIYLTDLDKSVRQFKVWYFRYADDFLVASDSADQATLAAQHLDSGIADLKLGLKASHKQNLSYVDEPRFDKITRFKHLGLEFMDNGKVKLAVEKQRKIINFFKRSLKAKKTAIKKLKTIDEKLSMSVNVVNDVIHDRIRSAAIVDYYLKHVNDEIQLKNMDRIVTEMIISVILEKKFRKGDFRKVPYKKLRDAGLISLLHRNRLHRHGHLKVNFLSLYNEKVTNRHTYMMKKREERINYMRISKKIKREKLREIVDAREKSECKSDQAGTQEVVAKEVRQSSQG